MTMNQSGRSLLRMGYKTASQRPQCGNCKCKVVHFINPDSYCESERYRCGKGQFATTKNAICDEWEAQR
jgi:hypothetical protein